MAEDPAIKLSSRLRHQDLDFSEDNAQYDVVRVRNLLLIIPVGDSAQWPSDSAPVRQPVRVSLTIPRDLRGAAHGDDISQSINYGSLASTIINSFDTKETSSFLSLEGLLDHVFRTCFKAFESIQRMSVKLVKPRATPYADAVGIVSSRSRDGALLAQDCFFLEKLACNLIVGLNAYEREDKQVIHFDVDIARLNQSEKAFDFRVLARVLRQKAEESEFISLESLASLVAEGTLQHSAQKSDVVTVRAAKPKALVFAEAAEVEIVRTPRDYHATSSERGQPAILRTTGPLEAYPADVTPLGLASLLDRSYGAQSTLTSGLHSAAIALGSNLGDRFANIEAALRLLEQPERFLSFNKELGSPPGLKITVMDTSFMYETAPMYVTDQPSFVNCACMVVTDLPPQLLLFVVKAIETTVGRVPSIRNGPRAVDLDIILYDNTISDTRPVTERSNLDNLEGQLLTPHPRMAEREFVLRPLNDMIPDYVHPVVNKPICQLLSEVLASTPAGTPAMNKVMPFPRYPCLSALDAPVKATPAVPSTATYWKFPPATTPHNQLAYPRRTRLMATLNATPDSFSDGSAHNTLDTALAYARSSVAAGADIVDIGGYSTRPGAAYLSPEEEISRVVPIVKLIRSSEPTAEWPHRDILISVDTFRPDVARAAVLAGANCINDVYAFTGTEYPLTAASAEHFVQMRRTVRELAVPVVLMHSRGDAATNKDYSAYEYSKGGAVLAGVTLELGEKVDLAVRGPGGIRRWFVMVDPGVGFSKTLEGNLEILRDASKITAATVSQVGGESSNVVNPLRGFPQLIGASRKSFLGAILSKPDIDGSYQGRHTEPKDREWAAAAAVTSAVAQGAAVVRVHDVTGMGDVVRIANAVWS